MFILQQYLLAYVEIEKKKIKNKRVDTINIKNLVIMALIQSFLPFLD